MDLNNLLDAITLESLKNPGFPNTSRPNAVMGTMWYNPESGIIYGFGSARPENSYEEDVETVKVKYAGEHGVNGPVAELEDQRATNKLPGLEKALSAIKLYNEYKKN